MGQKLTQMTKYWNCTKLSQTWCKTYFRICWLWIWTKILKILSLKWSKWLKNWHKWQTIEIARNFLKIGEKTYFKCAHNEHGQWFWKCGHQSCPNGTKSGTNDQILKLHRIISKLVQNLFRMCWLWLWTKILKILSLKLSKWHKKWHKWPNIEIAQNYLKLGVKSISNMLVMNMDEDFENIVTKVVQMAQKWHKWPNIEIAQNYLKLGVKSISNVLVMNMDEDFENIVTKVVQMAQNWHKWQTIEIARNCLKIGAKPTSSLLIMNMDNDFENVVTKVVQMAQKVAQMTKYWNCTELSQSCCKTYFECADYDHGRRFWNYCH